MPDAGVRAYFGVVNAGTNGHGYVNVYTPGLKKLVKTYATGLDAPSGGTFEGAGNTYGSNLGAARRSRGGRLSGFRGGTRGGRMGSFHRS